MHDNIENVCVVSRREWETARRSLLAGRWECERLRDDGSPRGSESRWAFDGNSGRGPLVHLPRELHR